MKCKICNVSPFKKMLHGIKNKSGINKYFLCIDCLQKQNKKLANEIKNDKLLNSLNEICFNQKPQTK